MNARMLNTTIGLLLVLISMSDIKAQGERDYWYFGQLAGMKFGNFGPTSISDNSIERVIVFGMIEGPANYVCASDEEGNLMFYTDGHTYRNRLHENMLNSPVEEYALRRSFTAVARDPGNPDIYYCFIIIADGIRGILTYTVVDMSMNNGLGGLDPDRTNVIMLSDVGLQLTTARHANGKDTWLICVNQGRYRAFLITENGISTTPESSNAGISFFDGNATLRGRLEVSPNNKYIAATFPLMNKLFLTEFDNNTGRLSLVYEEGEQDFFAPAFGAVEFSPNSELLYTTFDGDILQYDISDTDNITPGGVNVAAGGSGFLKLGPDGKIYVSQFNDPFVGAIQDPNVLGLGCNYSNNVQSLSGTTLGDLPSFLLYKVPEGLSYTNICEGETTEFNYVVRGRDITYTWNLGDGNIVVEDNLDGETILHTYANPGTYNVTVEAFDNETNTVAYTDEAEITIYASPDIPEPEDIYECTEDVTILFAEYNEGILNGLDPSVFDVKYYLSENDAKIRSNDVEEFTPEIGTRTIWLRVENRLSPSCHVMANFNISTPEFFSIDMESEFYICDDREGATLTAPDGFASYAWSTGEDTQSITVYFEGIYTLYVEKDFGDFICSAQIDISVIRGSNANPEIVDIRIIDWSQNHNSIEVILSENGFYEYSIDGVNYQDSPIISNLPIDDYYVYVRNARCFQEVRSDKLFLLYYKKFFTPNNDGVNDYWQIINAYTEENIDITIFDRYGKLLYNM
ncbi:MAG: T9SS type B sorting domain-containing protein, partial [Bacteroidota bacterium]